MHPLPDWPRPRYEPDPVAPLLYYRVYGRLDLSQPLRGDCYRCAGVPAGITVSRLDRHEHAAQFREVLEAPMVSVLRESLPGLDTLVDAADAACVILGLPAHDGTLNYFRDTIGLITWMLDHGGSLVYDPMQLRCWSANQWREEVFAPSDPEPQKHCVILVSEDEQRPGRWWYHTRGLRKFGRPDVSIRGVPRESGDAAAELCQRLIVFQAEGAVVPDGAPIRMAGLPEDVGVRTVGSVDDPDFNNIHLDITFPAWSGTPGA